MCMVREIVLLVKANIGITKKDTISHPVPRDRTIIKKTVLFSERDNVDNAEIKKVTPP